MFYYLLVSQPNQLWPYTFFTCIYVCIFRADSQASFFEKHHMHQNPSKILLALPACIRAIACYDCGKKMVDGYLLIVRKKVLHACMKLKARSKWIISYSCDDDTVTGRTWVERDLAQILTPPLPRFHNVPHVRDGRKDAYEKRRRRRRAWSEGRRNWIWICCWEFLAKIWWVSWGTVIGRRINQGDVWLVGQFWAFWVVRGAGGIAIKEGGHK